MIDPSFYRIGARPPGIEKRQETFLNLEAGFSKGPVAFRGPKANFKIKTC